MKYLTKEVCRLLPKKADESFEERYSKMTAEEQNAAFAEMVKRVRKAWNEYTYYYCMIAGNLPDHIKQNYGFHDRTVLSAQADGKDFVLTLSPDEDQPFNEVRYIDAEVLENEDIAGCVWVYDEVNISPDGTPEYHALLEGGRDDYRYLTVKAKNIEFI